MALLHRLCSSSIIFYCTNCKILPEHQLHQFVIRMTDVKQSLFLGKQMDSQSTSAWKADHNLAIFSSGKCLPAGGASNKFVVGSNVAWPQIAPVELTQKKLST